MDIEDRGNAPHGFALARLLELGVHERAEGVERSELSREQREALGVEAFEASALGVAGLDAEPERVAELT